MLFTSLKKHQVHNLLNRPILVNFWKSPLKLGRVIVLQATHPLLLKKFGSHGNSLISSIPNLISSLFFGDPMFKKHL